ncbi:tumor necrosis factor receptor superfamily member 14-like [Hemibagrus wyckioides]|uniref:tumor necrosis factor receptor superfamily member 14-like n=1 Tax=Hemibagrus wyckioides TaxID=337641 RepID=UPI00266C39DA|nr:tumor necrosis factor receptor superfamily member 14-like [Hemibagrus wyckioides]
METTRSLEVCCSVCKPLQKSPTSGMLHIWQVKRIYAIYSVILNLSGMCCTACNTAEYEINGECCPMCAPGQHVLKHCNSQSGTQCKVCTGSTYTDVPNGLTACLPCAVCDEGNGVHVKHKCSSTSDALCEPLSGYYCTETQAFAHKWKSISWIQDF